MTYNFRGMKQRPTPSRIRNANNEPVAIPVTDCESLAVWNKRAKSRVSVAWCAYAYVHARDT